MMRRQIELWELQRQDGREVRAAIAATVDDEVLASLGDTLVDRLHALLFDATAGGPPEVPEPGGQGLRLETIESIVCDGLRQQRLDPSRSFLHLGLSSVSAAQIATRLSRQAGREVPPQTLFEHSTIQALAEHLGAEE